ncbi:MAG TPA: LysM domain-containing protein [Segetibacter sp.]|jgi:hypothetical protein
MKFSDVLKTLFAVALVLFSSVTHAQKQRLYAQSTSAGLFIDYKVSPKETFNSIATIYNISPDSLAEFNNMDYYEGELIAKTLRVPLKKQNFYQKGAVDSTEALIPVYHLTTSTQTMQQISNKFNKISVATLNKWNGVPKTGIVRGMQILIGFLRAKPDQLAYFEEPTPLDVAMVEKPVQPKTTPIKVEKKIDSATVVAKVDKPKQEPKVNTEKKDSTKTEIKPIAEKMVYKGFFRTNYKPTKPAEKRLTGDASIFVSKTGWNDGKYYVLMPKVKPGSIVKVTSANTTIYAKVLGDMPVMTENKDILLRLSNSAATELGVTDGKFPVVVTY